MSASTGAAVLQIEGVSKRWGRKEALRDVSFSLPRGEFVGLLGHNGAGKSTLIGILLGLVQPTEGSVTICGVDVSADPRRALRHLGAVPEEPAVLEDLSAREFLAFCRDVREAGDLDEALAIADLGEDAARPIREYSQGMRRRTALAAALLGRPELIVLDEALNGLDPPSLAAVRHTLRRRVDEGATVLLATHLVDTVARVSDRVILLAHGEVVDDLDARALGVEGLERLFLERIRRHDG